MSLNLLFLPVKSDCVASISSGRSGLPAFRGARAGSMAFWLLPAAPANLTPHAPEAGWAHPEGRYSGSSTVYFGTLVGRSLLLSGYFCLVSFIAFASERNRFPENVPSMKSVVKWPSK